MYLLILVWYVNLEHNNTLYPYGQIAGQPKSKFKVTKQVLVSV